MEPLGIPPLAVRRRARAEPPPIPGTAAGWGPAAVLAACGDAETPTAPLPPAEPAPLPPPAPEPPEIAPFFKDPAPFIQHGGGLEARLEDMPGLITRNELCFVRNNGGSPGMRESDWRLVVEGDAVENPIELTYPEIRGLPPHTLTAYLECPADLGWRRCEINWEAAPGNHTVMTRATDRSGAAQPDTVPWNRKGYLFNQPLPHPIRVAWEAGATGGCVLRYSRR